MVLICLFLLQDKWQDVRNGNIYFEDSTYGKIRILAADYAIPCGTIVKITNVTFSQEPIIGIVLDRGGAIKGNIMDFLVTETDDMDIVGRQRGVNYEILRWGWWLIKWMKTKIFF